MSLASRDAPAGTPDLERLTARMRGGWRRYALGAALLLVLGLAGVAWGLASGRPAALSPAAPGLLAAALAALPWREAVERRDRLEGLEVLQQEWPDLARDAPERERLAGLIERMFGRRPVEGGGA